MLQLVVKPVVGMLGAVAGELIALVRLPSTLVGVGRDLSSIRADVQTLDEEVRRMRAGVDGLGVHVEPVPEQMAQIAEGFALLGPELHDINQAVRPLRRARARLAGGGAAQPPDEPQTGVAS